MFGLSASGGRPWGGQLDVGAQTAAVRCRFAKGRGFFRSSARRCTLAAVPLVLALLCGACSRNAKVWYRVSYTLSDNGVSRSASGVWSSVVRPALIPLADKYQLEFHGEAIPLRLPGRGVLLLMPIGNQGSEGDADTMVRQLFSHRASAKDSDRVGNTADVADMVGDSRPTRCQRYAIPQPRRER